MEGIKFPSAHQLITLTIALAIVFLALRFVAPESVKQYFRV
jgi:hypothetical protein